MLSSSHRDAASSFAGSTPSNQRLDERLVQKRFFGPEPTSLNIPAASDSDSDSDIDTPRYKLTL